MRPILRRLATLAFVRALVLALVVLGLATSAAARGVTAPVGCPNDPSLGSVSFSRSGAQHHVSLADCRDRVTGRARSWTEPATYRSRDGRVAAIRAVRRPGAPTGSQSITVDGRVVYRVAEDYRSFPGGSPGPLGLLGWSPDSRWLLFYVDPMASASIAADGLDVKVLDVAHGRAHSLGPMLLASDYRSWCGSTLVLTSGNDRLATHNKQLVAAGPPDWRPRNLWPDRKRAFGSVACAPGRRSVAVLSQRDATDSAFFRTRWQLWRVGLDGSRHLLDSPSPGSADESPRWSRDGRSLLFVRERKGWGTLMLLRKGAIARVASLGYSLGYYGHHDWWLGASWSAGA
jgi:hypothetical protein